jgi:hypothetical protein
MSEQDLVTSKELTSELVQDLAAQSGLALLPGWVHQGEAKYNLERFAAMVLAQCSSNEPESSRWWCETCQRTVDPIDVTYDETHDFRKGGCGQHVFVRSALPPGTALLPKLDATMPTAWHYLLVAAHQVVEAIDFNHENKDAPLKWTVPWAKVTTLRDAVLKTRMLNGEPGPSQPPLDGQCDICVKPLPPVAEWSMPSCPDCQQVLESLGEIMADFIDRDQTSKAEMICSAVNLICSRPVRPPRLSLEQRMHRFPKRGWAIDVGVPFSASDPEAEHPLTFRAKHLGGDWDEFESLDLDGAVTWLEQRLGLTKGGDQ